MVDFSSSRMWDVHAHPFLNRGPVSADQFAILTGFGGGAGEYFAEGGITPDAGIDAEIQQWKRSTTWHKLLVKELATYLGADHVIGCANGTDALQIAMMALGLKPGDEVITASFTFVATVEVVALLGITPVFADVLPGTFNLDPADIERKITPRTTTTELKNCREIPPD